jgi:hypothetical protein
MQLWVAGRVLHGEHRCARDDAADNGKASRWHMFRAQTDVTVMRGWGEDPFALQRPHMLVGCPYRDAVMGHDLVVARRQTHVGHPCLDEG